MKVIRETKIPKRRNAKGEEVETYASNVLIARMFLLCSCLQVEERNLTNLQFRFGRPWNNRYHRCISI